MKRKRRITKTAINRILKESIIDPREAGPLTLVIDEYINDPEYFEKKARELIIEAKYSMDQSSDPEFRTKHGLPVYKEKMQKAVFCLAVARWIREN